MSVRGIGRSRPRDQRFAVVVAGCTIRSPRPASRASCTASGRRYSIASAPTSTVTPPTSARASFPPIDGPASRTTTSTPGAVRRTAAAAASPAMPPPTTTTRGAGGGGLGVTRHRLAKTWSRSPPRRNRTSMGCVTVARDGPTARPARNGAGHAQQDTQAHDGGRCAGRTGRSHRLQRRRGEQRQSDSASSAGGRHPSRPSARTARQHRREGRPRREPNRGHREGDHPHRRGVADREGPREGPRRHRRPDGGGRRLGRQRGEQPRPARPAGAVDGGAAGPGREVQGRQERVDEDGQAADVRRDEQGRHHAGDRRRGAGADPAEQPGRPAAASSAPPRTSRTCSTSRRRSPSGSPSSSR